MFYFPTAAELYYKDLLENLLDQMKKARSHYYADFIDVTLGNNTVINYLIEKGYNVKELRYEYKNNVYGYYGRQAGDGSVLVRISWNGNMSHVLGNFQSVLNPIFFN